MSNLTYIKKYDTIFKKTFFNMRVPHRYSYTLPSTLSAIKMNTKHMFGYTIILIKSQAPLNVMLDLILYLSAILKALI